MRLQNSVDWLNRVELYVKNRTFLGVFYDFGFRSCFQFQQQKHRWNYVWNLSTCRGYYVGRRGDGLTKKTNFSEEFLFVMSRLDKWWLCRYFCQDCVPGLYSGRTRFDSGCGHELTRLKMFGLIIQVQRWCIDYIMAASFQIHYLPITLPHFWNTDIVVRSPHKPRVELMWCKCFTVHFGASMNS